MSELVWGPILAAYLFLGGLAGGSYIVGAAADLMKKEKYAVFTKSAVLASVVSIILGLVMLVFDLKRFMVAPLGIVNAYRRFPGSIMTVGTWIITAFTLVSVVTVLMLFLDGNVLIRKIVEVVGIVLGLSTCAYTGILLSFTRGVPFWDSGFLPWLFVMSGMLTGLAVGVLFIPIIAEIIPKPFGNFRALWKDTGRFSEMIEYTDRYATSILVIEFLLMVLYFITTPPTRILLGGSLISLVFYAYLLFALAIPFGISVVNMTLAKQGKHQIMIYLSLFATVMALFGGFLLRYVVLIGGQMIF